MEKQLTIHVTEWDSALYGQISEQAIRLLHVPNGHFRFKRAVFPAGTRFPGSMRAGTCYVLSGRCAYHFTNEVEIAANQVANLPEGEHEFWVLGKDTCELVLVWELPKEFWQDA